MGWVGKEQHVQNADVVDIWIDVMILKNVRIIILIKLILRWN